MLQIHELGAGGRSAREDRARKLDSRLVAPVCGFHEIDRLIGRNQRDRTATETRPSQASPETGRMIPGELREKIELEGGNPVEIAQAPV